MNWNGTSECGLCSSTQRDLASTAFPSEGLELRDAMICIYSGGVSWQALDHLITQVFTVLWAPEPLLAHSNPTDYMSYQDIQCTFHFLFIWIDEHDLIDTVNQYHVQ